MHQCFVSNDGDIISRILLVNEVKWKVNYSCYYDIKLYYLKVNLIIAISSAMKAQYRQERDVFEQIIKELNLVSK